MQNFQHPEVKLLFVFKLQSNLIGRIKQKYNMIISYNSTIKQRKNNLDRCIAFKVISDKIVNFFCEIFFIRN